MKKDISPKVAIGIAALLVAVKLAFTSMQMMYILPMSATFDDDLYFKLAQNISQGAWLGAYDYLTLSKYPLFALWLAFVHKLGLNYLIANQLLWIAACAFGTVCFAPVLKKNLHRLLLFAALLFNPSLSTDYTLRVYRDSIFPILCFVFFVALSGFALRQKQKIKNNIGFLIMAGFGLGFAWICREDGFWLLPFALAATIICACYICFDKNLQNKAKRLICLTIPYFMTALCALTICSINYKYYNRFIISDFTSKEFKTAYGNMTRLSQERWNPLVAVPTDVRMRMYESCESFGQFKYYLEESPISQGFRNPVFDDYQSGSFYWALRRSAQELGIYKDADTAKEYFEKLAQEIEVLCSRDENALAKRSATTSPIRAEYVPLVLEEVAQEMKYVICFEGMKGYYPDDLSDASTGQIEKWESFLNTKSNYSAIEYTATPYYSTRQLAAYKLYDAVTWIYRALVPIGLVLCLIGSVKNLVLFKKKNEQIQLLAIICPGLLLMGIFRMFIIAYMEVSAFNIGIYSMYLGTVYPLAVLCAFMGAVLIKE